MKSIEQTNQTVSPEQQSGEFPDLDDAGLALRLRQSISTIRAWRCRHPQRLPPGIRVGRIWLYDKEVVEKWLAAKRMPTPQTIAKEPVEPTLTGTGRRGKPSKEESTAAKMMGLTVPAWRNWKSGRLA